VCIEFVVFITLLIIGSNLVWDVTGLAFVTKWRSTLASCETLDDAHYVALDKHFLDDITKFSLCAVSFWVRYEVTDILFSTFPVVESLPEGVSDA
jgi:hypothetical protein